MTPLFGYMTCKIISEITGNVSSGTLNPTIPYCVSAASQLTGERREWETSNNQPAAIKQAELASLSGIAHEGCP